MIPTFWRSDVRHRLKYSPKVTHLVSHRSREEITLTVWLRGHALDPGSKAILTVFTNSFVQTHCGLCANSGLSWVFWANVPGRKSQRVRKRG